MDKRFLIALFVTGTVAGALIVMQLTYPVASDSTFPADEIEAKEELIKEYLDEQASLQSRIVFLRKQIEDAQEEISIKQENSNLDLLDGLEQALGLKEVSGSGLEIVLDDSPFAIREGANVSDVNLIQASDVRDIINLLNAANADAISVNNQRITATSTINSVGTTILINNAYTTPPLTIQAVGDREVMLQRLLNKALLMSFYERISKNHLYFKIFEKNRLSIPIFNSELKTNYINLVDK